MTTGNVVSKKHNDNLTKLAICHVGGFLFITAFAMFAHEIAAAFPNVITRLILPANVSLGQQAKLMVTPLVILFTVEYFIVGKEFDGFIPIHMSITAAAPLLTLGIYHVHNLVFKRPLSFQGAQIMLSVALVVSALLLSIFMITSEKSYKKLTVPALIVLIIIVVGLGVATFFPPHIDTFYDTLHQTYGMIY